MRRAAVFLTCAAAVATSAVAAETSLRSTGQLEYRLEDAPQEAPTRVIERGKERPALKRVTAKVYMGMIECVGIGPAGTVRIDTTCCEWRRSQDGEEILVGRRDFSKVDAPQWWRRERHAECRRRALNGGRP